MSSAAFHSWGSTLEILDGTFFSVIECSVIAISYTADELDITNHESLDSWRENVRGLKSCEILVEGNLIIASDSHGWVSSHGIMTLFDSGELAVWRLTFKNATPITFTAFVPEYTWNNDVEDKIHFSLRLRVSGEITESQLILDLWSEDFNYAPLDEGGFILAYEEQWDYFEGLSFVEQYLEEWSYEEFQIANLQWLEEWNYDVPPDEDFVLQYTEDWES